MHRSAEEKCKFKNKKTNRSRRRKVVIGYNCMIGGDGMGRIADWFEAFLAGLCCLLYLGVLRFGSGRNQTETPSDSSENVLESEGKQPEQPLGARLT